MDFNCMVYNAMPLYGDGSSTRSYKDLIIIKKTLEAREKLYYLKPHLNPVLTKLDCMKWFAGLSSLLSGFTAMFIAASCACNALR